MSLVLRVALIFPGALIVALILVGAVRFELDRHRWKMPAAWINEHR